MAANERLEEINPLADEVTVEIGELVNQLARLSKSTASPGEFYVKVIDSVMLGLKASGAAIWIRSSHRKAQLAYQVMPPQLWPGDSQRGRPPLIELVLNTGQTGILPPGCLPSDDQGSNNPGANNPTQCLLIVCPWLLEGEVAGVLEVLKTPGASAEVQTGYVRFLEAIGDLIANQERAAQLHDYRQRLQDWQRFEQFSEMVHGNVELRATAYTIANEGRLFLGCDRLSVLVKRRGRLRLLAMSGVDTFQRRARVFRLAERLCKAVVAMNETLWHPESAQNQPPQVETLLSEYLDETHASALAIVPLSVTSPLGADVPRGRLPRDEQAPDDEARNAPLQKVPVLGALLIERFYGGMEDKLRRNLDRFSLHSAIALRNALEFHDLPLSGLLRKARWMTANRRPLKMAAVLAISGLIAALLCFVPAELRISKGELQPRRLQDVYAKIDGVVADVSVQHGQHVAANQTLATLRRPQLDFEFKQVSGELQTARKRLAAIEAERVQTPRDTEEQRRQYGLLAAQGEEVRELIRSLEAQYAILELKQKDLEVRSPIDGEVLTWDVQRLLSARPVDHGQALLTVGDLSGPWQLDLRVPDRHIAYVLAAQREKGEKLEVGYVLGTAPAVQLHGTIREVALRTEVPEGDPPYVQVFVDIDRDEIPELVPGASVVATIRCGQRSAGYVWLHDLIDAARTWLVW